MKSPPATVGFRVKSGWATVVLLIGPVHLPQVIDSRIIDLSDPDLPESKQPYHARMGVLEQDSSTIERRTKVVANVTKKSVAKLLKSYHEMGYQPCGGGLVVGSKIDPAAIKNPHIRAHALEGRLFRSVLEDAIRSHGLSCQVIVERNAYALAASKLSRSESELKRALLDLGRLQKPWRADEKMAVLAAWLALAELQYM